MRLTRRGRRGEMRRGRGRREEKGEVDVEEEEEVRGGLGSRG